MNNRVKEIRKKFKLTQSEFAESLGLSRNFIAQVEMGISRFSDRTIGDICREYQIRREWLVDGVLPMEAPRTRNQILIDYIDSCMEQPDSFKARFAEAMAKLSDEQWVQLAEIFSTMAEKKQEP